MFFLHKHIYADYIFWARRHSFGKIKPVVRLKLLLVL